MEVGGGVFPHLGEMVLAFRGVFFGGFGFQEVQAKHPKSSIKTSAVLFVTQRMAFFRDLQATEFGTYMICTIDVGCVKD